MFRNENSKVIKEQKKNNKLIKNKKRCVKQFIFRTTIKHIKQFFKTYLKK